MKNPVRLLLVAGATLALAGCGSFSKPGYNCPLEEGGGSCNSMQAAYKASTSGRKSAPVAPGNAAPDAASQYQPIEFSNTAPVPSTRSGGMPVYEQPKVNSIWVPPYVDADGNLREGSFVYSATPGRWNYGTTKRTGRAGAAFGPIRSDSLGFDPELNNQKKPAGAPPKPGDANTPASVPAPAADSVEGITQPYQRLIK